MKPYDSFSKPIMKPGDNVSKSIMKLKYNKYIYIYMPIYIYAHFSLSRDNQILKFIISTLEKLKVYNKYCIKPEIFTFCHYNDFLSCIIFIDAFLKYFFYIFWK